MKEIIFRGEKMPAWVRGIREGDNAILIDPDLAYPAFLAELEMEPTQTSLGIAQKCVIQHILELVGPGLTFNFSEKHKKPEDRKWRFTNFPEGPNPGESEHMVDFRSKYWEPLKKKRLLLKAQLHSDG